MSSNIFPVQSIIPLLGAVSDGHDTEDCKQKAIFTHLHTKHIHTLTHGYIARTDTKAGKGITTRLGQMQVVREKLSPPIVL